MYRNSYDDLIEPWKVNLITSRAKRRGLRNADLEDAQQTLVLELLDFAFDPAKSNGATEATALVAVIDRRLAMMNRSERRHRVRIERLTQVITRETSDEELAVGHQEIELAWDVREAIDDLPPLAQEICRALAGGQSLNEIAKRLGIPWRAVRQQIDGVRRYFEYVGLGESSETLDREGATP